MHAAKLLSYTIYKNHSIQHIKLPFFYFAGRKLHLAINREWNYACGVSSYYCQAKDNKTNKMAYNKLSSKF